MKRISVLLFLPVLAGCFTASVPEISLWPVAIDATRVVKSEPRFDVARLAQLTVRSPWDSREMSVLLPGGKMAFDHYNEFAAHPSQLLKGAVYDAMEASGLFRSVVNSVSAARASVTIELSVEKLALDCRTEGRRAAIVDLHLRILDGREIAVETDGAGAADAASGNYGAAFSEAMTAALSEALSKVK